MSAYILDDKHINTLIAFELTDRYSMGMVRPFYNGKRYEFTGEEAGRILAEQNVKSVNHRYRETTPVTYRYDNVWTIPAALVILKACTCYDYQSCETPDYYDTLACAIVDHIRHTAIRRLPGYDDADGWHIRDDEPAPVPAPVVPGYTRAPERAKRTRKARKSPARPMLVIVTTEEDVMAAMAAAERGF